MTTNTILNLDNPFGLADLSAHVENMKPNPGVVKQSGIFSEMFADQRLVSFDIEDHKGEMLPVPEGVFNHAEKNVLKTATFSLTRYHMERRISAEEVMRYRRAGSAGATMLSDVIAKNLMQIRTEMDLTIERTRIRSLVDGKVIGYNGQVNVDWYAENGLVQAEVDLALGSSSTEVHTKIQDALTLARAGGNYGASGYACFMSPTLFNKFVGHRSVKDAFTLSQSINPYKDGIQTGVAGARVFPFAGVTFLEVPDINSAMPNMEGRLVAVGGDLYRTYFAPVYSFSNDMDAIVPRKLYVKQFSDERETHLTISAEMILGNVLTMPASVVRVFSA